MNSRKKRIYSLLASALIFSSLGFVSGTENQLIGQKRQLVSKKVSVSELLNMKYQHGQCFQPTEKASNEEKLITRLITIISHQITNAIQKPKSKNVSALQHSLYTKLNKDSASSRAQKIKKGLQELNLPMDKVTLWWAALVLNPMNPTDRTIYEGQLTKKDKRMYKFLYENRKRQFYDKYKMEELLDNLNDEERADWFDFQREMNSAISIIINALAPAKKDLKEAWMKSVSCDGKIGLTYLGGNEFLVRPHDETPQKGINSDEKFYTKEDFDQSEYDPEDSFIDNESADNNDVYTSVFDLMKKAK